MICIFKSCGIPTDLPDTASLWLRFGSLVLHLVAHQPIGFRAATPAGNTEGKAKSGSNEVIERIRVSSAAKFGMSTDSHCFYFDRSAILEPDDDDPYFRWRLEFLLDEGTRLGKLGRVIFHDPNPFHVNDLGLRPAKGRQAIQRAIEKYLQDMWIQDNLVVVQTPRSE